MAGVPCGECAPGGNVFKICFSAISEEASEVREAIPRHPVGLEGLEMDTAGADSGWFSQQLGGTFKEAPLGGNLFIYS